MAMAMEREIRYQDQRRKIDIHKFLHKRAGEFQDEVLAKTSMMIYGIEKCEIVAASVIRITLGENEESSYSMKLEKILEAHEVSPENVEYIEVFDRARDENGNVIRENRRIDNYNQYLVNKSADEYDQYFDDMIASESRNMYQGIDQVFTQMIAQSMGNNSSLVAHPIHALSALQLEENEDVDGDGSNPTEIVINLLNAISGSTTGSHLLQHSLQELIQPQMEPDVGQEEGDGTRPPAPEPEEGEGEGETEGEAEEEGEQNIGVVYEDDGNLEPMPPLNPFQPTILESRLINALMNPFSGLTQQNTLVGPSSASSVFFPSRFYTFNIPTTYNIDGIVSQMGQQIGQQLVDIKVTLSPEEYDAITTHTFGECEPEEKEAQSMCIVCSENFAESDVVKITKCHHIIHDECLRPWLLKESKKCPVCRCELAKGVAHLPPQEGEEGDEEEKEDDPDHS
jgi:hypothetical protein